MCGLIVTFRSTWVCLRMANLMAVAHVRDWGALVASSWPTIIVPHLSLSFANHSKTVFSAIITVVFYSARLHSSVLVINCIHNSGYVLLFTLFNCRSVRPEFVCFIERCLNTTSFAHKSHCKRSSSLSALCLLHVSYEFVDLTLLIRGFDRFNGWLKSVGFFFVF